VRRAAAGATAGKGANQNIDDGAATKVLTRKDAARDAGLSERQKARTELGRGNCALAQVDPVKMMLPRTLALTRSGQKD